MLKLTCLLISMGSVGSYFMSNPPELRNSLHYSRHVVEQRVLTANATRLEVIVPFGHVTLIADNSPNVTIRTSRSARLPLDSLAANGWMPPSLPLPITAAC